MIFIAAANEPTVFVMLTVADMQTMLGGRTMFVDAEQFAKGKSYKKIILSVSKTQDDILTNLRTAGHKVPSELFQHTPTETQDVCIGCKGCIGKTLLLDAKCIACWREQATKRIAESN